MEPEKAEKLNRLDYRVTRWMYIYGKPMLRFSIAIVFIWFGVLKVFLDSPAQGLIAATVYWFDPVIFIPILGIWEVLIGLFMMIRKTIRLALILLVFQMPGTFLPLVVLPEVCFEEFPFELTNEGQYIIKNLVVICAAIVAGGSIRERQFVAQDLKSADAE